MKRIHLLKRLCWGLALAVLLSAAASAAATAAPMIRVTTLKPDYVTPGKFMLLYVNVMNVGDTAMSGNLTIRYTFPAEVAVVDPELDGSPAPTCTPTGQVDECVIDMTGVPLGRTSLYRTLTVVDPAATGMLTGQLDVSGGGASNSVSIPLTFNTDPIGPFDVKDFGVGITDNTTLDPAQAGSAPTDITTNAEMFSQASTNLDFPGFTTSAPTENFRNVTVHVPPGFVGNPTVTPVRCTAAQLAQTAPGLQSPNCPRDSQIGLGLINNKDIVPVYNLVPPNGAPAEFGFYYQGLIVNLRAKLRPSDNGIDIMTVNAPSSVPLPAFEVTLWGVPSANVYDNVRAECTVNLYGAGGNLCPSLAPRVPFLRLPTSCTGDPLPWSMDLTTYQSPEINHHRDATTPAVGGCDLNPFDPSLTLVPSTLAPRSSAGVDTTLAMPQAVGPNGIAPADISRVSVTLPEGMAINPSSADGLKACADSDLKLRQEGAATCDPASKLGTVTVRTPLLDHPIGGSVFLRTQNSNDPQSGELFRIAIELRSDDDGVVIKLPGAIKADPTTGQLTTVFDDLPQLPFESMDLHFKTGPRAPLVTPGQCGTNTTSTVMTSWGGKTVTSDSSFTISGDGNGSACPAPQFKPTLHAGLKSPVAGSSSTFVVRLQRDDIDNEFKTISTTMPPGLLAKVAGVPLCSDAAAAAGNCPADSQIGRVEVGAGAGSNPFYITNGKVYLTEGYKGGPYGLSISVPAVAGPFDLGTVNVRAALQIDPITAQVTVVSDPMPRILQGIPLQVRDVRVIVDRDGFMQSPTNCNEMSVGATVGSYSDDSASVSNRFRVGGCAGLAFAPKISMGFTNRSQVHKRKKPGLDFKLSQKPGEANIKSVTVKLPRSVVLDVNGASGALCEVAQAENGSCPASSIVGHATAVTPLLDQPLTGAVYFVRGDNALPNIMVALRGAININLRSKSKVDKMGRLISTFGTVPDAPIRQFHLTLGSAGRGVLSVAPDSDLCKGRNSKGKASIAIIGQNGKRESLAFKMRTPCKSKRKHKR